ncbi:hypothetical protein Lfu02_01790 [Longispora fulva]|uniref:Uncharacterized protein n=1 Tax=Longispora fulva TaxID=619741 RepID=A0A8J7KIA1_9ACTN|nr:hypothetical protein [Longispora fulva]MBG6135949.1 hypothetical protein [Longispora fulva]GIG55807.1 hypothetical protein Lfu02_01790 [Longispora fulva]
MTVWKLVLGIVLVLMGGLWTLQGLGYVGGGFMIGSRAWEAFGPVVAMTGPVWAVTGLYLAFTARPRA